MTTPSEPEQQPAADQQADRHDIDVTLAPTRPPQRRTNKTMRDMALSMGLIALVVLAFVAINGALNVAPGAPEQAGELPTADAVGEFEKAPRLLPFAPAVPRGLPERWHANSAATTNPETVEDGQPLTVRGGWLTGDGRFIALVASNAPADQLLAAEFDTVAPGAGQVSVDGVDWTVTAGVRSEAAWYTTADGGITYLVTGSAGDSAFRTLAGSLRLD